MRLTLIHPCIGRRAGQRYIRSWEMEPLPPATIAGLTPSDVDDPVLRRSDGDRFRSTSRRTSWPSASRPTRRGAPYQIASEYRAPRHAGRHGRLSRDALPRRGLAVRRSGRHRRGGGDLAAARSTTSVTAAGAVLSRRTAALAARLAAGPPDLSRQALSADRSRRGRARLSLPLRVLRRADRCSRNTQTRRPLDEVIAEVALDHATARSCSSSSTTTSRRTWRRRRSSSARSRPLGIRWVSQSSINAAHDEEFLDLLAQQRLPGRADRLREPQPGRPRRR